MFALTFDLYSEKYTVQYLIFLIFTASINPKCPFTFPEESRSPTVTQRESSFPKLRRANSQGRGLQSPREAIQEKVQQ